jgi:hypothetical protein
MTESLTDAVRRARQIEFGEEFTAADIDTAKGVEPRRIHNVLLKLVDQGVLVRNENGRFRKAGRHWIHSRRLAG